MRNNDLSKKPVASAGAGAGLPVDTEAAKSRQLPGGGLPTVDTEAVRSRQLPPPPAVERSLPKPPPAVCNLQAINPDMNASRQSFRLAMGNACK